MNTGSLLTGDLPKLLQNESYATVCKKIKPASGGWLASKSIRNKYFDSLVQVNRPLLCGQYKKEACKG